MKATRSNIVHIGVPLLTVLALVKVLVSLILDMINRHRIVGNLNRINKIDKKVRD